MAVGRPLGEGEGRIEAWYRNRQPLDDAAKRSRFDPRPWHHFREWLRAALDI